MSPVRRTPKPKLLLDEGFPPRSLFSNLNSYCDVKHIAHDFKNYAGSSDTAVYQKACELGRVLVVFNIKDFIRLVTPEGSSVIGVGQHMKRSDIDAKLTALMRSKLKPIQYKGQYISLNSGIAKPISL